MVDLHRGSKMVVPSGKFLGGLVSVWELGDVAVPWERFERDWLDTAVGSGFGLGPCVHGVGSWVLSHGLAQVKRFPQCGDGWRFHIAVDFDA